MGSADATLPPTAEIVGNVFVTQYYHILHHSPEIAYRFYCDKSFICRPNHEGHMTIATTMNRINDVICSFDYKNYEAEIETVDAQPSSHSGVFLLVTGSLTANDRQKMRFMQTFFLAPQETGYFILNDILRYLDGRTPEIVSRLGFGVDGTLSNNLHHGPEPAENDPPQPDIHEAVIQKVEEVPVETPELPKSDPLNAPVKEIEVVEKKDNGQMISVGLPCPDKDNVVKAKPHSNGNHVPVDSEKDPQKKSYACAVSSQKKKGPTKIYVPATLPREAPAKVAKPSVNQPSEVSVSGVSLHQTPVTAPENNNIPGQCHEPKAAVTKVKKPSSSHSEVSLSEVSLHQTPAAAPENNDMPDKEEDHTIYVGYLPLNATVAQLREVFKKFGPINAAGIQVRRNWQQGFCFGFVEFQELISMQNAIKASPVMIGGSQAVVEPRRTTSRVNNGGNHLASGHGDFHNENFRGQGNYGRRQYYVRSDNFPNHGSSDGAKAYHQGRGRGDHQIGSNQNLVRAQR